MNTMVQSRNSTGDQDSVWGLNGWLPFAVPLWIDGLRALLLKVLQHAWEEVNNMAQVTPVSLSYLLLGGFATTFSVVSLLLKEKLYLGEAVLGTGLGILVGPRYMQIYDPRGWGVSSSSTFAPSIFSSLLSGSKIFSEALSVTNETIPYSPFPYPTPESTTATLELTRVVLAVGLFAIGVELPQRYVYEHARSVAVMVFSTMTVGWFISAGLIRILFPSLAYTTCLVISACLTPTDPVLSTSIVQGKFATRYVPHHIRMLLLAESAVNDGMAYPFLTLSFALTLGGVAGKPTSEVVLQWLLVGVLYQVVFGIALGTLLGWTCSVVMQLSHRKGLIDKESLVAQYLALSIFTVGLVSTLGSDDLLASFAAGTALAWNGHFKSNMEDEVFAYVIEFVLNCACFTYIGAWLPFAQFDLPDLGVDLWRLIALFVGILLLRRIPCLLAVYKWIPDVKTWREALFCGHFGPMGVGAVFVSTLALSELPPPTYPPETQVDWLALVLQPIVSFIVLGSILTHGLSIPFFWYGSKTLSLTRAMSKTSTTRSNILASNRSVSANRFGNAVIDGDPSSDVIDTRTPGFHEHDIGDGSSSNIHRMMGGDIDIEAASVASSSKFMPSVDSLVQPAGI